MTFLTCEGRLGTTVRAMGVQLPGTAPGALPEKRLGLRDSSPMLNICWCLWKIRLGLFCSQPWARLALFVKLVMDGVHTGSWEAACPDQAAGLHLPPCCCTICVSSELSQENEGIDGPEGHPCSFILELSCPGVCLFDGRPFQLDALCPPAQQPLWSLRVGLSPSLQCPKSFTYREVFCIPVGRRAHSVEFYFPMELRLYWDGENLNFSLYGLSSPGPENFLFLSI